MISLSPHNNYAIWVLFIAVNNSSWQDIWAGATKYAHKGENTKLEWVAAMEYFFWEMIFSVNPIVVWLFIFLMKIVFAFI